MEYSDTVFLHRQEVLVNGHEIDNTSDNAFSLI